MAETELVSLAIAQMLASVSQFRDELDAMRSEIRQNNREICDLRDIFRNCACFGAGDQTWSEP